MTTKNENVINFPETAQGEFKKMYMVGMGDPQSEYFYEEIHGDLNEAIESIKYNIELDEIGTKISIESVMGKELINQSPKKPAPKITRENLNSLSVPAEQVFEYVRQLYLRGEVMTQVEFIILAFMADSNPTISEMLEGKEANIANTETFPPEFSEAMEKYKAMLDENSGIETDEARDQFAKAMLLAPDWFHEMAMSEAKTMGLIPKATHCLENGEPVFSLEEIATHLGISLEDAQKSLDKLITQREEMGLEGVRAIDPSLVQKIQ